MGHQAAPFFDCWTQPPIPAVPAPTACPHHRWRPAPNPCTHLLGRFDISPTHQQLKHIPPEIPHDQIIPQNQALIFRLISRFEKRATISRCNSMSENLDECRTDRGSENQKIAGKPGLTGQRWAGRLICTRKRGDPSASP